MSIYDITFEPDPLDRADHRRLTWRRNSDIPVAGELLPEPTDEELATLVGNIIIRSVLGEWNNMPLDAIGGWLLTKGVEDRLASHVLDRIADWRREQPVDWLDEAWADIEPHELEPEAPRFPDEALPLEPSKVGGIAFK